MVHLSYMHTAGRIFQSLLSVFVIGVLGAMVNLYFQLGNGGTFYTWLISGLAIYFIVVVNLNTWGKLSSAQFRLAFFAAVILTAIVVTIHNVTNIF